MITNLNKSTIEGLKSTLQHKILCLLSEAQLDEDEFEIISRAMQYIVKSHNSYDEQYYRINEYIIIANSLYHKHCIDCAGVICMPPDTLDDYEF